VSTSFLLLIVLRQVLQSLALLHGQGLVHLLIT
jgi:hypothetical protein